MDMILSTSTWYITEKYRLPARTALLRMLHVGAGTAPRFTCCVCLRIYLLLQVHFLLDLFFCVNLNLCVHSMIFRIFFFVHISHFTSPFYHFLAFIGMVLVIMIRGSFSFWWPICFFFWEMRCADDSTKSRNDENICGTMKFGFNSRSFFTHAVCDFSNMGLSKVSDPDRPEINSSINCRFRTKKIGRKASNLTPQ